MLAKRLEKLNPYIPGEQPKDREYTKLNANENAYPPPIEVTDAVKKLLDTNKHALSLYPDPDAYLLKCAIANMLNKTGGVFSNAEKASDKLKTKITPEMIFCGNGSDEVLSFVFYAFFDSGLPVITPEFSYSFYPVYAGYYDINLEKIPLLGDYSLDIETMTQKAKNGCSGMIFANPNAPTSIALSCEKIREMLDAFPKDKVFVVDEAYTDFNTESVLPLLSEYKNLVVVRTFSKSLAFAGMRCGYVVASPELINAITTVKNSFNHFPADNICQTAAQAACNCYPYYIEVTQKIINTRDSFRNKLLNKGWIVLPSATNFVFVRHPTFTGKEVYAKIKEQGFLVRHFNIKGIENFIRITIGTQEQMDSLLEIMSSF